MHSSDPDAEALRQRIAKTAESATGVPADHWLKVIGRIDPAGESWAVSSFRGDPTDHAIALRLADEVRRHFPRMVSSDAEAGGGNAARSSADHPCVETIFAR
jgi:hypothetical protein